MPRACWARRSSSWAISTTLGMWKGALDKAVLAPLAAQRERMMARPAYERARDRLSAP